jgi:hypothetical protein
VGGQAGPIGIHANFGDRRTDGNKVDHCLVMGPPVHIDSPRLGGEERLRYTLGLNFQLGPQMNVNAQGHGDTSTRHASLPPPPAAADRRIACLILPSMHSTLETSWLKSFGRRVLDAVQPLREPSSLSTEIEGSAQSKSTKSSLLGLGKPHAEGVTGYLALRYRMDPQRMRSLSDGEARFIAEKRTGEGRTLK